MVALSCDDTVQYVSSICAGVYGVLLRKFKWGNSMSLCLTVFAFIVQYIEVKQWQYYMLFSSCVNVGDGGQITACDLCRSNDTFFHVIVTC